ncbi:DUF2207 family protein [Adlercreutzia shanghongiae]|uniref:DUF2207 domain-containing protein n=1 Tax=Adlercreutzia shanghongiae TaxID=3111773 RepID=A0ABU6IW47_9ACTN|nr:DUF2207 domain-containing protein [Adlercreutzia sp. R22]MEC4293857.1 DUF2207 domain-containing protein [Adlercreutzia sp. R22]
MALILLVVMLIPVFGWATPAFAADYRCAEVDLLASVETDGSVQMTDQRIFDLTEEEGSHERLKWLYDGFIEGSEIAIDRVRMAPVDEAGALKTEWVELPETTFQLSWRGGGAPEHDAWAYDKFRHTLYAFVDAMPDRVMFEVDYRVENAIEAFDDAADFQWLYVPQDYDVALANVRAEVVLPVAADDLVKPMDNVYAWGHGPADGSVDIRSDGTIVFEDPGVEPSEYAKARVMFPVEWLTNLSEEAKLANQGSLQYYWTSRYEETWVDTDTSREVIRLGLAEGLLALSAVLLLGALFAWWRWGRERPPAFRDDYWMNPPVDALAPAVLGRLWRWNHESPDDLVATVLDMVRRGLLEVKDDALVIPSAGEGLSDEQVATEQDACPDEAVLDQATLRFLRTISTGGRTLTAAKLSALAHEHPRDFLEANAAWQRQLTALVEPYGFFDKASRRAQHIVLWAAAALALLGVAGIIWIGWRSGVLALLAAAATGVLGNYITRRSPEGNDIAAHAKALRNWMRDGGWQIEGDRLTAEERAALIPYAYLFGVVKSLGVDEEADSLVALAPKLSKSLDEALRAAHKRAEVS